MPARSVRLNARLRPALARKVAALQRRSHKSLTDIVHESLELYCDQKLSRAGDALHILQSSGYIGCADGPEDLSSRYKEELRTSFGRKR